MYNILGIDYMDRVKGLYCGFDNKKDAQKSAMYYRRLKDDMGMMPRYKKIIIEKYTDS